MPNEPASRRPLTASADAEGVTDAAIGKEQRTAWNLGQSAIVVGILFTIACVIRGLDVAGLFESSEYAEGPAVFPQLIDLAYSWILAMAAVYAVYVLTLVHRRMVPTVPRPPLDERAIARIERDRGTPTA